MDKAKATSQVEKIRDRIAGAGSTRELIQLAKEMGEFLKHYFPNSQLKQNSTLQLSQLQKLYNEEIGGLLSFSAQNTSRNQWLNQFLKLIGETLDAIKAYERPVTGIEPKESVSAEKTEEKSVVINKNLSEKEKKKVVLFVSASPENKVILRVGDEVKFIKDAKLANAAFKGESYKLSEEYEVERDQFSQIVRRVDPDILHISVHADKEKGLIFQDEQKKVAHIAADQLIHILKRQERQGKKVSCLILNGCNTAPIVKGCEQYVDYVVSTKGFVLDDAATRFTKGFYQMLFECGELEEAYSEGLFMIMDEKQSQLYSLFPNEPIPDLIEETGEHVLDPEEFEQERYTTSTEDSSSPSSGNGSQHNRLSLFLSYAHEDEELKNKLDTHLAGLKRGNKIDVWQDRELIPGQDWDETIKQELQQADIILLLISANFIASDYIWREELTRAMEQGQSGKSVVVPIALKPCDWSKMPFARLQALPRDAKPVSSYANIDVALMEVAKGIRAVVEYVEGKKGLG